MYRRIFIREWRKHRGLTLEQLADRIGTTHASLCRIERGRQPHTQGLFEAIAEALRVEPADLLTRDPSDPEVTAEPGQIIFIKKRR
jgi:transcriptional regulator with XRE-family HTH domain